MSEIQVDCEASERLESVECCAQYKYRRFIRLVKGYLHPFVYFASILFVQGEAIIFVVDIQFSKYVRYYVITNLFLSFLSINTKNT